jgi:hypothetical protein
MKKLLIICNGPSTKNLDWDFLNKNKDKIDTFCVNGIYRKFEELNFYPTYFGCFDYVVGKYHEKEFQKLLDESTIKQFYFLNNLTLKDKHNKLNTIVIKEQKKKYISKKYGKFNDWLNSGANSLQIGCMLGYKEIYIVGVDGYKVKKLDVSKQYGKRLIITETPEKNPNYFFDDYQRKNDIYNKIGNFHQKPGWELSGEITKDNNIKVYNMGNRKYIKCYEFISLSDFYEKVSS